MGRKNISVIVLDFVPLTNFGSNEIRILWSIDGKCDEELLASYGQKILALRKKKYLIMEMVEEYL